MDARVNKRKTTPMPAMQPGLDGQPVQSAMLTEFADPTVTPDPAAQYQDALATRPLPGQLPLAPQE